jgi:hypothetical protein
MVVVGRVGRDIHGRVAVVFPLPPPPQLVLVLMGDGRRATGSMVVAFMSTE